LKNTYYFSHDTNANRDEKILAMRVDYGWEGYGWYWAIVETMAESSNYKLKIKNGVPNRVAIAGLSLCHNIPIDKLEIYIDNCIKKYGLFDTDGEYFWSRTLLKRLSIRDEKTNKLRDAGLKGAEKRWGSCSLPIGQANNYPNGNKRKGKEIKLNENKEKEEKKISFSFRDKKFLNLPLIKMEVFEEKYPDKNVYAEIEKMEKWLIAEKGKKDKGEKNKIPKNYSQFINNWLGKE
jgi:hypothetical protein